MFEASSLGRDSCKTKKKRVMKREKLNYLLKRASLSASADFETVAKLQKLQSSAGESEADFSEVLRELLGTLIYRGLSQA